MAAQMVVHSCSHSKGHVRKGGHERSNLHACMRAVVNTLKASFFQTWKVSGSKIVGCSTSQLGKTPHVSCGRSVHEFTPVINQHAHIPSRTTSTAPTAVAFLEPLEYVLPPTSTAYRCRLGRCAHASISLSVRPSVT